MNWESEAIVVTVQPLGESRLLMRLLTPAHGLVAGISRRAARSGAALPPGTVVTAAWRGKTATSLGWWTLEPVAMPAAKLLSDPPQLLALQTAMRLLGQLLPDPSPHPRLYHATRAWLAALEGESWLADYVRWELILLEELGYGLDLSRCAVTGATDPLSHVSPKTGRAVSPAAAAPYAHRLLPLPAFLQHTAARPTCAAVREGLKLTRFFLEHRLYQPHRWKLPEGRLLLEEAALD